MSERIRINRIFLLPDLYDSGISCTCAKSFTLQNNQASKRMYNEISSRSFSASPVLRMTALLCVFIFVFTCPPTHSETATYDFLIALDYFEGPTSNRYTHFAVFRKENSVYFQCGGSGIREYKRPLDENEYRTIVSRLTAAGVLMLQGKRQNNYEGAFYKITVVSGKTLQESFHYPDRNGDYSKGCPEEVIRIMRNYGVFFSPFN